MEVIFSDFISSVRIFVNLTCWMCKNQSAGFVHIAINNRRGVLLQNAQIYVEIFTNLHEYGRHVTENRMYSETLRFTWISY